MRAGCISLIERYILFSWLRLSLSKGHSKSFLFTEKISLFLLLGIKWKRNFSYDKEDLKCYEAVFSFIYGFVYRGSLLLGFQ